MKNIVGVKFKHTNRIYYFDGLDLELRPGDYIIVETARGVEFASILTTNIGLKPEEKNMHIKPVIRKATSDDIKQYHINNEKKSEAMRLCQEKIEKCGLEMKLIDAEYTIDNTKVVFYFTADGRVDFRTLVKELAVVFKRRIELRQIGVRDEAKMLGGIGSCGRALCCSKWLSDFQPVSIKMAKTQDISLNPTKISGNCGRLMCCLNYENETYVEARKGLPSVGDKIKTREGYFIVVSVDILNESVKAKKYIDRDEENKKTNVEVFTFTKSEIKNINSKNQHKKEEKIPEEVKELLKD